MSYNKNLIIEHLLTEQLLKEAAVGNENALHLNLHPHQYSSESVMPHMGDGVLFLKTYSPSQAASNFLNSMERIQKSGLFMQSNKLKILALMMR